MSILTAAAFLLVGDAWLATDGHLLALGAVFAGLFALILWSAFAVVRHADALAVQLGEPYGTLILTLSVITIEVMMISAVMLAGSETPTLARDTMYAVLMIVLNGMVGICLLLGGLKHSEQQYNLQGANAFLAVIVPLAFLGLVLPNYTRATTDPTFSTGQSIFLVIMSLGIYSVFLAIQTVRHRAHFVQPGGDLLDQAADEDHVHRPIAYHAILLVCYLIPVALLSKKLAVPMEHGISVIGAPAALGGFLVAVLVLSPEALGAVHAAMANQLQRAVNIFLGSVLATISLTIPAVLTIGLLTDRQVWLGLDHEEIVMLLVTLLVSTLTFASGRTNVLQGAVHLLLFLAYFMLIFDVPTPDP
ncbi:MAG: calcium:proton antiporter [Gammaproteobacteria bacterium]|nr:calcium:proton antiporter [Gammaproteobacteria bacterium]